MGNGDGEGEKSIPEYFPLRCNEKSEGDSPKSTRSAFAHPVRTNADSVE
jgi:hypothetical protein